MTENTYLSKIQAPPTDMSVPKEHGALFSSLEFIPNIKLLNALSKEIADEKEGFKKGDFVWNQNNIGKKFTAIIISYRPRATIFEGGKVIFNSHDMSAPQFQECLKSSESGKRAGPEFLLWLPEQQGFGLYHFTKTARNNAGLFSSRIGKAITFTSTMAENKDGQKWYTPTCNDHEVSAKDLAGPSEELFEKIMGMFNNPKKYEEAAEVSGRDR